MKSLFTAAGADADLAQAGERWANGRPQEDDVTFVVMKIKA
jgi:hypothetical protein